MAIKKRYCNEAENKAIIEKVAKVLNSTDYPTHKTIIIEASGDTMTTIRYNITEIIVPEDTAEAPKDYVMKEGES